MATTQPATAKRRRKRQLFPSFFSIFVVFHLLIPLAFFEPFFTWWFPAYLLIGNFIFGSIGINLAYHRLLTHRSVEVPKWLEKIFVGCGLCSLEGPPFHWVCIHRIHHQKSDEDQDPHSPKDDFFWGHVGWIFKDKPENRSFATYDKYIPDLMSEPYLLWLHKKERWFKFWLLHIVVLLGIAGFIGGIVGGWAGMWTGLAQMFAWGIIMRTVYVWHITWFVNSAAHRWGYRNYSTTDHSTNNWWVAVLTNGEGWHNNHHASPRAASHGHRWWEVDLTYSFIRFLQLVGLAKKIVPVVVPKYRQEDSKEAATATVDTTTTTPTAA